MKDTMSVNEFVKKYEEGEFASTAREIQIAAGWYDWFCSDESLKRRMIPMANFLKRIKDCDKFDPDKTYVFFKNNFPMVGKTYDSFSICDLETGDVQFWIGFLPSGTYGISGYRVEVALVKDWSDKSKKTIVFENKNQALGWFRGDDSKGRIEDRV